MNSTLRRTPCVIYIVFYELIHLKLWHLNNYAVHISIKDTQRSIRGARNKTKVLLLCVVNFILTIVQLTDWAAFGFS